MKNIEIVNSQSISSYLMDNVWKSKEFKKLQQTNQFFKKLIEKLKHSPVYFYDISHPKGRNHLTSIFRFIARREYESELIQDLYYLHEFCHCAQYKAQDEISYEAWAEKLSINEMYASLVSEVFIYFFEPSIAEKTFNPLWAKRFLKVMEDKSYFQNSLGVFYHISDDEAWQQNYENYNILSLELKNWPLNIQEVIKQRQYLRTLNCADDLDEAQRVIVNYNQSHKKWIHLWKEHYLNIDLNLKEYMSKQLTDQDYLNFIIKNCDQWGRPFFPAKDNHFI